VKKRNLKKTKGVDAQTSSGASAIGAMGKKKEKKL